MKSYWSLCRLSGKNPAVPMDCRPGNCRHYSIIRKEVPREQADKQLLNILLNSPGQYFHYEELAARFQVSTRSIRNYTQSILDFLEDLHMPSALTVSEGGIAFTGGAEESSLLLQAAVDNDFYLYRLSPEERSHIILLNLLISDDYCNIYDLSEKIQCEPDYHIEGHGTGQGLSGKV